MKQVLLSLLIIILFVSIIFGQNIVSPIKIPSTIEGRKTRVLELEQQLKLKVNPKDQKELAMLYIT